MEVTELRIGSWINTIEGPHQIKAMSEEGLMATSIMTGGDLLAWAEPIPLTEEWLFKLGFIKYEGEMYLSLETGDPRWYLCASYQNRFADICQLGNLGALWRFQNIEYVHQLQNLYFTLTGNELTIHE